MAWHEEQPVVTEGFDTLTMLNLLQVWLPITFQTGTTHPPHEQKQFAMLTPSQKRQLVAPTEEAVVATHKLTQKDRDTLRGVLGAAASFEVGFFTAAVGNGMKIALPPGWLASAATLAVKTLVGFLLNQDSLKEKASFLSANLATGGELRECWHTVEMGGGNTFLHRAIQYEVRIGTEIRQFVLCSTRYAMKP